MIKFYKAAGKVILCYQPEFGTAENWAITELEEKGEVTIRRTFSFNKADRYFIEEQDIEDGFDYEDEMEAEPIYFIFAKSEGGYYKVTRNVIASEISIYFHEDVKITADLFIVEPKIPIFPLIEKVFQGKIYIGGEQPSAIPEETFRKLVFQFPNGTERSKYVQARVSAVLRDYFDGVKDAEKSFHKYLNKKITHHAGGFKKIFKEPELLKFQAIYDRLQFMLANENGFSEKQWQEEILQILLLIYPKYIYVFREVPIKDKSIGDKFVDYMLVDADGYTDIIEIKRPFNKSILTDSKYRNNYIPLRELSGTIMQIEKYIFYLNRWGSEGEVFLTNKYSQDLPHDFQIKITNPSGIIIMGRDINLSQEQKLDFEVVKRKYKNVFDIITYDNLLYRVKSTIDQIKKI